MKLTVPHYDIHGFGEFLNVISILMADVLTRERRGVDGPTRRRRRGMKRPEKGRSQRNERPASLTIADLSIDNRDRYKLILIFERWPPSNIHEARRQFRFTF